MSVQRIVFDRFTALYGLPKTENLNGFFAEYVHAFDGTEPGILQAAVSRIIKAHKFQSWPTVGEVNMAIHAVAADVDARQRLGQPQLPAPRHKQPTAAERARVAALVAKLTVTLQDAERETGMARQPLRSVDRDAWEARFPSRTEEAA